MKLLNYQFHQLKQPSNQATMVFIHGLFGDMNNLGIIARAFSDAYNILRLDLRNHGQSFHADEMNYSLMAQDIIHLLETLQLTKVILIGHSMGGKAAMKTAALHPDLVEKLICIDIGPIAYAHRWHDDVFAGLFAVKNAQASSRQEAKPILASYIKDEGVIQFMLKSFDGNAAEKFRFNLSALFNNYGQIMGWEEVFFDKPTLFIKGGNSDYLQSGYGTRILAQFPQASSFTINGSGHWVHAEKPEFVVRAIQRFLESN